METNLEKPYRQGLEINLIEHVKWETVLSQPRYAGGHDDVLENLFGGETEIAHWNEEDYSGQVATAHWLEGIGCVVITDYYGSCSGCDSWADSSEDEARKMVADLVNGAYVFLSRSLAKKWILEMDSKEEPWGFSKEAAKNLEIPDDPEEQHAGTPIPPEVEAIGQRLQEAKARLIRELAEARSGGIVLLKDMIQAGVVRMEVRGELEMVTYYGTDLVSFSPIRHGEPKGGKSLVESGGGYVFHVRYCLPH